jgi:hypothetical protein
MTCVPIRFSSVIASFGPTPGSTVVAANKPNISVGRRGCTLGQAFCRTDGQGVQSTTKLVAKQKPARHGRGRGIK